MLYREIAYRDFVMFDALVHRTLETSIPDSPMNPFSRWCPIAATHPSKWMVPIMLGFRDFQCPSSHDLENSDLPMDYLPRNFFRSDGCRRPSSAIIRTHPKCNHTLIFLLENSSSSFASCFSINENSSNNLPLCH
jgi:hypothetical protein